jgi:hypothetical protein
VKECKIEKISYKEFGKNWKKLKKGLNRTKIKMH